MNPIIMNTGMSEMRFLTEDCGEYGRAQAVGGIRRACRAGKDEAMDWSLKEATMRRVIEVYRQGVEDRKCGVLPSILVPMIAEAEMTEFEAPEVSNPQALQDCGGEIARLASLTENTPMDALFNEHIYVIQGCMKNLSYEDRAGMFSEMYERAMLDILSVARRIAGSELGDPEDYEAIQSAHLLLWLAGDSTPLSRKAALCSIMPDGYDLNFLWSDRELSARHLENVHKTLCYLMDVATAADFQVIETRIYQDLSRYLDDRYQADGSRGFWAKVKSQLSSLQASEGPQRTGRSCAENPSLF